MARFYARPNTVEAYQYHGNTLNFEGAFNAAVTKYQPGSRALVSYRGIVLPLEVGDWLVRGADGVVTPVTASAFEQTFQPMTDETVSEKRKLRNVG